MFPFCAGPINPRWLSISTQNEKLDWKYHHGGPNSTHVQRGWSKKEDVYYKLYNIMIFFHIFTFPCYRQPYWISWPCTNMASSEASLFCNAFLPSKFWYMFPEFRFSLELTACFYITKQWAHWYFSCKYRRVIIIH